MDEDDDCYGFGSYFTLFNGVPGPNEEKGCTSKSKMNSIVSESLDTLAISQHVVRDSVLRRLYEHHAIDVHNHVLAKFNRVMIGGGFGDLFLHTSMEDHCDSLIYRQKINSDSDKRQQMHEILAASRSCDDKDSYNITEEASHLLLFFSLKDITSVKPLEINESVHGASFELRSGHMLECVFMPGPLYRTTSRDEVIATIHKRQEAQMLSQYKGSLNENADCTSDSSDTQNDGGSACEQLICNEKTDQQVVHNHDQHDIAESLVAPNCSSSELDEVDRKLIRQYLKLDAGSEEAMTLAKQIQEETGYVIGPTKPLYPDFSTDAEHRQSILQWLSTAVEDMTRSWTNIDLLRERETNAKCVPKGTKELCYIDITSGEELSADDYRERYLKSIERSESFQETLTRQVALPVSQDTVPMASFKLPKRSLIIDEEFIKKFHADHPRGNDISDYISIANEDQKRKANAHYKPLLSEAFELAHRQWMERLTRIANVKPDAGAAQGSILHTEVTHLHTTRQQKQKKRRMSIANQIILPESGLDLEANNPQIYENISKAKETPIVPSAQEKARICELCCDKTVSVCMIPCHHKVCQTCWLRLSDSDDMSSSTSESKICPWDREMVRSEFFSE